MFVLRIEPDAFWIFSSLNHGCGCASLLVALLTRNTLGKPLYGYF